MSPRARTDFCGSAEFAEVKRLLGPILHHAVVADIGAGTGIASYALHKSGASRVFAVEPDASDEVGRGAIERLREDTATPIEILDGWGEELPLPDDSIDVVYSRQVLHHAADLERFMSEVARVLRPGGVLLACREHVVDNDSQKREFLDSHPVHRLAGGENAFSLPQYLAAIAASGLVVRALLGPWDSVINAFPAVRSVMNSPITRRDDWKSVSAPRGDLSRGCQESPRLSGGAFGARAPEGCTRFSARKNPGPTRDSMPGRGRGDQEHSRRPASALDSLRPSRSATRWLRMADRRSSAPQIGFAWERARTCKTRCSMSCRAESPLEMTCSLAIAAWSSLGHIMSATSDLVVKRQYPWRVATS